MVYTILEWCQEAICIESDQVPGNRESIRKTSKSQSSGEKRADLLDLSPDTLYCVPGIRGVMYVLRSVVCRLLREW